MQPTTYTILVYIPNGPPFYLDGVPPLDIDVPVNKKIFMPFPLVKDPELQPVLITHSVLPEFVQFDGLDYIIEPVSI